MFHQNLREARENCNLSQKELAELICVPVSTYRNYENTLREPSFDILIKLSEILHISLDELLGAKKVDDKYKSLFIKIKMLDKSKLQTIIDLTDFLSNTK